MSKEHEHEWFEVERAGLAFLMSYFIREACNGCMTARDRLVLAESSLIVTT